MNWMKYIAGQFYEARARRAIRAYHIFKKKAEKYFREVGL